MEAALPACAGARPPGVTIIRQLIELPAPQIDAVRAGLPRSVGQQP
jgi:hypothetical protein